MNDIAKIEKEVSYSELLKESKLRRFKLSYTEKEFYFLTWEEKDFLLKSFENGAERVYIGEHVFGKNFRTLVPVRNKNSGILEEVLKKHGYT